MGEVYRARDSKLQRDVALKILPDLFALDVERLARFRREAQVLASLNHPNIAAIYGLEESAPSAGQAGVLALVLELVEGPTLADRIAEGPIPFDEARKIARQIAEALETAHEQGIVHRDLKPANVKLRADGTVKVLDFGLAKAFDSTSSVRHVSMSPTITTPAATGVGMILGTAAYMAPEQARGRAVDKRADIWAFGAVLYEMVTGRRAFDGEGVTDMLGAVIHKEPAWEALPPDTPPRLADLIRRCLRKDPRDRLRDIGDARIALDEALTPAPAAVFPAARSPRGIWRERLAWIVAAVAIIATLPFVVSHLRETRPAAAMFRFNLPSPDGTVFSGGVAYAPGAAVSPDGRFLVFMAARSSGGAAQLWLRSLDTLEARPLAGTEGALFPFWSPDSRFVAFFSTAKLKKIDISGGPAQTLCDAPSGEGGTWNRDGTIVFAPSGNTGLFRVPAAGGQATAVTSLDTARKATSHRWPQFLPDGRRFLFIAQPGNAVSVGSLDSPETRPLLNAESRAEYAAPGYLLFVRQGTLMARPFDASRAELTGDAVPIAEQVRSSAGNGRAAFSVSGAGVLVYRTADSSAGSPIWVDRGGREVAPIVTTPLASAEFPRLSPDGRRLVLVVAGDVWVYDLEGRPPVKITFDGDHFAALWTPDGRRIVYESNAPSPLKSLAADGSGGTAEVLTPVAHFHPHGWVGGGQELLVVGLERPTGNDILRIRPGEKSEPEVVVQTPASEGGLGTSLSPDGRWLAYTSDSTGQTEIWVRPYPGPGAAVRVSPNGGVEPIWARNGRELYYLEGSRMMAIPVDAGADFNFKPPAILFESAYVRNGTQPPSYDVAADGRFLMIKSANARSTTSAPLNIVLNWAEKLRASPR